MYVRTCIYKIVKNYSAISISSVWPLLQQQQYYPLLDTTGHMRFVFYITVDPDCFAYAGSMFVCAATDNILMITQECYQYYPDKVKN